MPTRSVKVHYSTFDTGTGNQTLTYELNEIDLSFATALLIEAKVTKADTDAADELHIRLQETTDRVVWNTRARLTKFTGDQSPSVTAPEYQRATLNQFVDLASTEEAYEPSGSAGATDLAEGSVLNGPFPGIYRDATARKRMPNWRFTVTVSGDANTNADFEGSLKLWAVSLY
jgi:hypothetical protein